MGQSRNNTQKADLNKLTIDQSKNCLSFGLAAMKGSHYHKLRLEKVHGRHSSCDLEFQSKSPS